VPVAPSSEGLALVGARAPVCARDAASASLDLSVALAEAMPISALGPPWHPKTGPLARPASRL
jgi:hypothetical protein